MNAIKSRDLVGLLRAWLARQWNARSLAAQFVIVGGIVAFAAIVVVGFAVRTVIQNNFTHNAAATTALYVDSVIAPLLPDMRRNEILAEPVAHALDETLGQGALGRRLFSFRLWRKDGAILYSNRAELTGKTFALNDDLRAAFNGKMVAKFGDVDEPGSEAERESGQPFLEIYNPILQPWSGEVVAVSEFYEVAPEFEKQLDQALLRSWVAVGAAVVVLFLALSSIVVRGSRTIAEQRQALVDHVRRLSKSAEQNGVLSNKVLRASQKTSEINEQYLRRIAADLHDGPAQLLALAALHLDSKTMSSRSAPDREAIIISVKKCVSDAMEEVRGISKGLMLPNIEKASLPHIVRLAVSEYQQRTGSVIDLKLSGRKPDLGRFEKIAIYRFIQETLNNGFHHAGAIDQSVTETSDDLRVMIEVCDQGKGFDQSIPNDGMGLIGLRERIESLGGTFDVTTSAQGTRVCMSFARQGNRLE